MTESQIVLIDSFEYRRRRFIRSFIAQSILQALTFGAAIVAYHLIAMPQIVNEAYIDGRLDGHKCALLPSSIPFPEVCKGWKPQWTPNK